jgi:hypothetical protein
MAVFCVLDSGEPVLGFGDHEDMRGGLGVDIAECQDFWCLVNDCGRDLFSDDLVENCLLVFHCLVKDIM